MKAISLKISSSNVRKSRFLLFETVHLERHQQRSFALKMHQNRWRLGLRPPPDHTVEAYSVPQPPSWIKGTTSKGRGKGG